MTLLDDTIRLIEDERRRQLLRFGRSSVAVVVSPAAWVRIRQDVADLSGGTPSPVREPQGPADGGGEVLAGTIHGVAVTVDAQLAGVVVRVAGYDGAVAAEAVSTWKKLKDLVDGAGNGPPVE